MADWTVKRNDTRPTLALTLKEGDAANPTAINLATASSVKLLMKVGGTTVSRAAVITNASQGQITVTFQAADTAVSGNFQAEVQITWSDGGIETVPNDGYLAISIIDDLGS